MKKLLIIAAMTLFAATAFAADFKFNGYYFVEGRYLANHQFAEKDGNTKAYYWHKLRLIGTFNIDERTSVTFRWEPVYEENFGTPVAVQAPNRAFATFFIMPTLKLEAGKITGGLWGTDFGRGAGRLDGQEWGGRDGFQLTYGLDEKSKNNVMAFAYKLRDGYLNSKPYDNTLTQGNIHSNAKDSDQFGITYNGYFGDVKVMPTFAFTNFVKEDTGNATLNRTTTYELNLGVAYMPKTGVQAQAAVVYVMGDDENAVFNAIPVGSSSNDIATYGLYADVAYASEAFKAGAYVAYASYDKENGYFNFGGNFDKTTVIDDMYFDQTGVPAMTAIGLYGNVAVANNIAIKPLVAYYMSNVDSGSLVAPRNSSFWTGGNSFGQGYIGQDTTILEADLNAEYKVTPSVTLSGGYSYVQINDIYTNATTSHDAEAMHRASWRLNFAF